MIQLSHRVRITSAAAVVCIAALIAGIVPATAQDQPKNRKNGVDTEQPTLTERAGTPASGTIEVPVVDSLYFIGPGDELIVSVFANQFYNYTIPVQSDGSIVVPMIGEIAVRNSSLRDVRLRLLALLRAQIRSGDILVNLGKPRQVKVTVAGAIRKPGIVQLPATARVSEALDLTGGEIVDTTSLRNIVVQRLDGSIFVADLMRYYRTGDTKANPFVSGGDVITFPRKDEILGIFGAVKREGWVDFVEHETLKDAFEVAQGLKASAFLDSIEVVRFEDDNRTTMRIFVDLGGYPDCRNLDFPLKSNDLILVRAMPEFRKHNLVVVEGEVNYTGSYGIIEGETTLIDLINWAGGFTKDASLEESTITRKTDENEQDRELERLRKIPPADMTEDEYEYFKARSRERIGQMVVNFKKLFLQRDTSENIFLRDGDVVMIPKLKNYIRVIGRVNTPGNVIFEPAWGFEQYIAAAGGYGWRAKDNDVRVIKARTGELVDAEDVEDYLLEPGDTIWVPEESVVKFWEIALGALGVISQIAGIVGIIVAISQINK